MTYFRDALLFANDEGYSMTDEGLSALYETFEHLAEGGNIFNQPDKTPKEVQIMLAVTWKDVRDYALIRRRWEQEKDS